MILLLVLIGTVAAGVMHKFDAMNTTIGRCRVFLLVSPLLILYSSCRDGIGRIAHARKMGKDLANNMLDAYVGLVEQYTRAFPKHDITLATFVQGYKDAAARSFDVSVLNGTIQAAFGSAASPGPWAAAYGQEWAAVTRNVLCSGKDVELLQAWATAVFQQDTVTSQLKEQNFWDGFGFLRSQGVTWAQGPGSGFVALVAFDALVAQSVNSTHVH
jgi:hypothetical protein